MDDLGKWLNGLGLGDYSGLFAENAIDQEVLPDLTDADLKELGIPLGHRKKLLKAISALSCEHRANEHIEEFDESPTSGRVVGSEAERRQLTVMFCDLVGSTDLSQRLDPEELHGLLAQYQDTCADVIKRYDGHIGRYVGDGLLVYFGFPQAHEDDAARAVQAGLRIVEDIRKLNDRITNPEIDLNVRIGINTGMVVAGDIGTGERREHNAIVGEMPNLAARFQGLAHPGTVVIGPSTYRLVEGQFEFKELGAHRLKGISKPVSAYSVRKGLAAVSRFEAAASRGVTPLVGREEEIRLLLKRWQQSRDGEAQVVILYGEAGIGKSRIVHSFLESAAGNAHEFVLYQGSPVYQNSALYPVIDQLEREFRLEKSANPAEKIEKLEATLEALGLAIQDSVPLLASLLSLPTSGRNPMQEMDAERLRTKTLEAIVEMIRAKSSQLPVLMVVEDAHWLDPSTLELIGTYIDQLKSNRFFLLITSRPEFKASWQAHTHSTLLTLNRFGVKESTAMIDRVTGGKALPVEVRKQLVAKTDGVPLFIEELTKMVLESELLRDAGGRYEIAGALPSLAIPMSLQDSLTARLDRLGKSKEVAQVAATLGRMFSLNILQMVTEWHKEDLVSSLEKLKQSELIFQRGRWPDATFEFKHALVQDTAYGLMLKGTRQKVHRKIAAVLEVSFPETHQTRPEVLAYHFTEGCLYDQAIPYWQRAGERAVERSANQEAIAHFSRALELLGHLPESHERDQLELMLQTDVGGSLLMVRGHTSTEVERSYSRARDLGQKVGGTPQVIPALFGLWRNNSARAEFSAARVLGEQILKLATASKSPADLVLGHVSLGFIDLFVGDLTSAQNHFKAGIELYDPEQRRNLVFRLGHDPGVACQAYRSLTWWLLGYPERAAARGRQAMELAKQLSHPYTMAFLLFRNAVLGKLNRDPETVYKCTDISLQVTIEHGFSMWTGIAAVHRGWALTQLGKTREGFDKLLEGLESVKQQGLRIVQPYYQSLLAEAYVSLGNIDGAMESLDNGLDVATENGEFWWVAELHRMRGDVLLTRSSKKDSEAEECFNQALAIARQQRAKSLELRAAVSMTRLQLARDNQNQARKILAPIYDWFTEGFDSKDLSEAKKLLDSIS